MDIYEALKRDHDQLKPLLQELVIATEINSGTKQVLKQIRDLLVPHSRAEEAVVYNSLRQTPEGKDIVAHSYTEHMEAEMLLRTLQGLSAIGIEWTTAAKKLRDSLEHHVREEETKIFSVARRVFTEEESIQLAQAFETLKPKVEHEGMMKNTLDMVANMMPKRFTPGEESVGRRSA